MLIFATIIILASVLIQFAAAGRALHLIKVTGKTTTWTLISLALIGMGIRRSFTVYYIIVGDITRIPNITYEIIGFVTSVCMLIGIMKIAPVFLFVKKSEETMRESEAKIRGIMESIPDPVFILKRDGTVIDYHGGRNIYLPVPPSLFLNKRIHDSVGDEIGEISINAIETAYKTGNLQRREFHFQDKDKIIYYDATYAIIGPDSVVTLVRDVTERKMAEVEREKLITQLQTALSEIRTLKGLLPICSACKKVRVSKEVWEPIESYIKRFSDAEFTHGICPECFKKLYPEIYFKEHNDADK